MTISIKEKVERSFDVIEAHEKDSIWISRLTREQAVHEAERLEKRHRHGDALPLFGWLIAVKDNIDVAGFPTTCAHPKRDDVRSVDAVVVAALRSAGALIVGKTNMDQFATGLVGARSPFGICHSIRDKALASGGSSSGSALAVAYGMVDGALGTDTAGSGRVPAAFNGIVGIKPTLGVLSMEGVVPACPSYDTVSVFARTVHEAELLFGQLFQYCQSLGTCRVWDCLAPFASASSSAPPKFAIPMEHNLEDMSQDARHQFAYTVSQLQSRSCTIRPVDIRPLLDCARLLYDGAVVAERTASFGQFAIEHPDDMDASVSVITKAGYAKTAVEFALDHSTMTQAIAEAREIFQEYDALLLPTVPGHPKISEILADPIGVNSWLGTFTNFVNLMDLSAVEIPGAGGEGVTLISQPFHDKLLIQLAKWVENETSDNEWLPPHIDLAVFGAHMTGLALNHELEAFGAVKMCDIETSADYRMYRLPTQPPKPGVVRVGRHQGHALQGEMWAIPEARLGDFLQGVPQPMTVGMVTVSDGSAVLGFLCEPAAVREGEELDATSWREVCDDERSDERGIQS
jgi:allophanate hydrolase